MKMQDITIIHKPSVEEPFLIVNKPHNLPTAPLFLDDKNNLLSFCIKQYPEIQNVKGKKEIEFGLLHRIDTVTSGIVLIACNQQYYDYLNELQKKEKIVKEYNALCNKQKIDDTFPLIEYEKEHNKILISSYFRYFGPGRKEVRPVSINANKRLLDKVGKLKIYKTEIKILSEKENSVEVCCKITNGFKHQVRCHLASIGFPIENDPVYNTNIANGDIKFTASAIEFDGKKWTI